MYLRIMCTRKALHVILCFPYFILCVQWDDATKFLDYAKIKGEDREEKVDSIAKKNPRRLMELQLRCLIYTSKSITSVDDREWYATTNYNSPYRMSYEEYRESKKNAGKLALVFHGSYERSADDKKRKQNRVNYANKWYDYFSNQL